MKTIVEKIEGYQTAILGQKLNQIRVTFVIFKDPSVIQGGRIDYLENKMGEF